MPRKKHSSFTFEPLERRVEVRLQQSNLKSGDEEAAVYYGQVQQRFAIGNAIAELAGDHSNPLSYGNHPVRGVPTVTHNMRNAIHYGNRLIMMLEKFHTVCGDDLANDRMLLS